MAKGFGKLVLNPQQEREAEILIKSVLKHFQQLHDPRVERTKDHSLEAIITIAILAVLSGADGFVAIARTKTNFFALLPSQAQICEALLCSQETARHWMVMAQTGQAHRWNDRPMGRPQTVNDQYLSRLKELVSNSPREYGYAFHRWTGQWLSKHLAKELGIEISACHVNRLLTKMGLSTRPKFTVEKTPNQNDNGSFNLEIRDLTSTTVPESSELWQFTLIR